MEDVDAEDVKEEDKVEVYRQKLPSWRQDSDKTLLKEVTSKTIRKKERKGRRLSYIPSLRYWKN